MRPLVSVSIAALLLAACGGEKTTGPAGTTAPPKPVASVQVTPSTHTLTALGATRQFQAVAKDADGTTVSGKTFTWSSSDESIATVSSSGLVTAIANGATTITATTDGIQGQASTTVAQAVSSVEVTPVETVLVSLGETVQLSASAHDANGNAIVGQTITWASSDENVATVSSSGLVTAQANGSATITPTTAGVQGSATIYVITDEYYATGINNLGQVVGWVETYTGDHAFLWTAADGMTDLGTLGGTFRNAARGINESGTVVGESGTASSDVHAFLWTAGGGMIDLGALGSGGSAAQDINDLDQVVGLSFTGQEHHVFLWTAAGGMTDLGTLGGPFGNAFGINVNGDVVGQSETATGEPRAFLWTAAGGMMDLGTLGGVSSAASDINDLGQIVGFGQMASQDIHAVIWTAGGTITDLGTLGGADSFGAAINASGDVVGWSTTASGEGHAFLWTGAGGMADLGTLGGSFSYASGINDLGDVVGQSETATGERHAFLWTAAGGMVDLGRLGGP